MTGTAGGVGGGAGTLCSIGIDLGDSGIVILIDSVGSKVGILWASVASFGLMGGLFGVAMFAFIVMIDCPEGTRA